MLNKIKNSKKVKATKLREEFNSWDEVWNSSAQLTFERELDDLNNAFLTTNEKLINNFRMIQAASF